MFSTSECSQNFCVSRSRASGVVPLFYLGLRLAWAMAVRGWREPRPCRWRSFSLEIEFKWDLYRVPVQVTIVSHNGQFMIKCSGVLSRSAILGIGTGFSVQRSEVHVQPHRSRLLGSSLAHTTLWIDRECGDRHMVEMVEWMVGGVSQIFGSCAVEGCRADVLTAWMRLVSLPFPERCLPMVGCTPRSDDGRLTIDAGHVSPRESCFGDQIPSGQRRTSERSCLLRICSELARRRRSAFIAARLRSGRTSKDPLWCGGPCVYLEEQCEFLDETGAITGAASCREEKPRWEKRTRTGEHGRCRSKAEVDPSVVSAHSV